MRSMSCPTFRLFLLAVLCASIVLAAGCAHKESVVPVAKPRPLFVGGTPKPDPASHKPIAAPPKNERPRIEFKFDAPSGKGSQTGVTLRWDEKNGNQMTASAKSGSFNEVTQVGTLLDFSAKLYENGKLTAAMTAPEATADTAKRVIVASGGVLLNSLERKTVVQAARVKWYANSHKIVGTGGVRIQSENGLATCEAFTADTSLKTYTLLSSAKGLE